MKERTPREIKISGILSKCLSNSFAVSDRPQYGPPGKIIEMLTTEERKILSTLTADELELPRDDGYEVHWFANSWAREHGIETLNELVTRLKRLHNVS